MAKIYTTSGDGGEQIAEAVALGDPFEAPSVQIKAVDGRGVDEEADANEHEQAALESVPENLFFGFTAKATSVEGIDERNSYEEEERDEDEIGGSPAVPIGTHDGPIGVFVAAGIVDEDHAGHHETAVDVETKQAAGEGG